MGVFNRFEKGIERAVNGAFAKAFRSEVQPVEVASALRRECDDRATVVGRDRYLAPNTYVVELGTADYERIGEWEDALAAELSAVVTEHAGQQRYGFVGPVSVAFEEAGDLDTGVFRVRSTMTQGAAPPSPPGGYPPAPGSGHPGPGHPGPGHPGPAGPGPLAGPAQAGGFPPPPLPGAPPVAAPGYPASPGYPPSPGYSPPGFEQSHGYQSPSHQPPADAGPIAPAGPAMLELNGQHYPLTAEVTVLGRSSSTDLPLDDTGVSRRHAEIRRSPAGHDLVDLGSTNGTYVNGERVTQVALIDGSQITIGRTRMVYRTGRGDHLR